MKILFSKTFLRQLEKAPSKIVIRFRSRLAIFVGNPHHSTLRYHSLSGEWTDHFSINITGDWRAVFQRDGDEIYFVAIGTHSKLYG